MIEMRRTPGVWSGMMQTVALALVGLSALAMLGWTLAGAFGAAPVLALPLTIGETTYPAAGLWIQGGVTALLLAIALALPAGMRVLRLEASHRDFAVTMSDVAEAYYLCHAADRADAFEMASEFDAVKERIQFLRRHPDLGGMEPAVLEAAAQMSYVSRDLATTYSDEAVARARGFLRHRQEEIALFEERFDRAKSACIELRRQRDEIEVEEQTAERRARFLEEEFGPLLEELGFTRRRDSRVVPLATHATAAE